MRSSILGSMTRRYPSLSQSAVYVRKPFTIGMRAVRGWASNATQTVLHRVAAWVKSAAQLQLGWVR